MEKRYWPKSPVIRESELIKIIETFHKYCDPRDMTYDDHLIWERWNKTFHPENYDTQ